MLLIIAVAAVIGASAQFVLAQQRSPASVAQVEKPANSQPPSPTPEPTVQDPPLSPTPSPTKVPTAAAAPTRPSAPPPATPTAPAPQASATAGDGYSKVTVNTDRGNFTVSYIGVPKGATHVVTDAASDGDCRDNCPVLSLADYVSRNGGFAGINGMYFCPADYPSCSSSKNSFDTLFFNSRSRAYLNSDNNVYSNLPWLAIEANGNPLFYSQTSQWGRDTGIQAGTAGNPMLIKNGQNVVGNYALDGKQQSVKSNRGAFAQKGNTIYLVVVQGATVPDAAAAMQALGMENAINIDGGGSSALWYNGSYLYGPGRAIPTAIIFTR